MKPGPTKLIERFKDKKICVVGDIIADIYIFGRPYRLSREAPVVVVKYEEERVYPGSAGNTINNLLALGANVVPLGFIGNDGVGDRLMDFFSRFDAIEVDGLIRHDGETITKTRILAGDTHTSKQQVIRIDRDNSMPPSQSKRNILLNKLQEIGPSMDAFIVSDYGYGAVDGAVVDYMRKAAKKTIVVGDARYRLEDFKGFTLITPNESEAYQLCNMDFDHDIEEVGRKIMGIMDVSALLITRGNKGISLFLKDGITHHIPISGKDAVTDVTGAGDTVCAAVTLALASGADFLTATRLANYAAGVVVMKRGTATLTQKELKIAMETYGTDSKRAR